MTAQLTVSKHACQRAHERFGVKLTGADNWIRQHFEHAEFIATIARNGNSARLFAHKGIAMLLDAHEDCVITIYAPNVARFIQRKLAAAATAELAKVQRRVNAKSRRTLTHQHELERELAERKLELMRARAAHRKLALRARIAALEARIAELPAEVDVAQAELNPYAKAVAAYV